MNEIASSTPFAPSPSAPKTFGQILDRTYRLMRTHLKLFLGIASVPCLALILIVAAVMGFMFIEIGPTIAQKTVPTPMFPLYLGAIMVPAELILLALFALYMPAASYAATQADQGVAVTFGQTYGVAWRRFGRSLWMMIVTVLYIIVPVVVAAVLIGIGALLLHRAAGVGASPNGTILLIPLLVLLYIGFAVYSIWIMVRFALAYPVCVSEELTGWSSLQRSVRLTKGAKARIFLVLLVVYAATYILSLVCICALCVLGAIGGLVAMLAHVTAGSPTFFVLIGLAVFGYLLTIVASALLSYAAYTTALAVLYHDQRLRKDGPLPAPPQAPEPA